MDNIITINDLLSHRMKFLIPSYQRGYRWTECQITALLNDIADFDQSKDGNFYCLQPLVVKYDNKEGKWRVIDGQQRLTTIYLILQAIDCKPSEMFEIAYERDSYIYDLEKYKNVICSDNIEIYHLTKAKIIISKWMTDEKKKDLREKILNQTKFIFYNVDNIENNSEYDIFNNLNSGKIPLTNAELIKALFLNKVGNEDVEHREVEQRLLADEFDKMERSLRHDDFWYFLAGNTEKPSSCINLLFDLMLETDNTNISYPKHEKFRTFFYFNDLINGGDRKDSYSKSKEIWENVKCVFHIMEGWFNDSVMYNLIGYHRAVNRKSLAELYMKFNSSQSKIEFKNWLKEECEEYIGYPDEFMNLRYDTDKSAAFNLLLLFNIATLLRKPQERVKFSFADFHKNRWDVEHISPQNPKDISIIKQKLRDCNSNHIFDSLLQNEVVNEEEINKYFAADDELMSVGNLTLLTAHDNRGIGNRFFFEKRQKLQEYYQGGSFIPMCSMNVFMKFYTYEPEQMLFWSKEDRKEYAEIIEKTITVFFTLKTEQR